MKRFRWKLIACVFAAVIATNVALLLLHRYEESAAYGVLSWVIDLPGMAALAMFFAFDRSFLPPSDAEGFDLLVFAIAALFSAAVWSSIVGLICRKKKPNHFPVPAPGAVH